MRVFVFGLVVLGMAVPACAISGTTAKVCDVRDFGAKGDGVTLDTDSIQRAIDACALNHGGGIVRLSGAGRFLSKALVLKSHIRFDIEGRSSLVDAQHRSAPGAITEPLELLSATNVEDVAVTGSGTIDASEHPQSKSPDRAITFVRVKRSRIEGLSIRGSFGVSLRDVRDVHMENVRIETPVTSNAVGVELAGSEGAVFDSVSFSGGAAGLLLGDATEHEYSDNLPSNVDVTITNCLFQHGDGLAIFAAQGVRATRLRFAGSSKAIAIASVLSPVTDLSFGDVRMVGVGKALDVRRDAKRVSQIELNDVVATGAKSAGEIRGGASGPDTPILGLKLRNVNIEADAGLVVAGVQGTLDNVAVKAGHGDGLMLAATANVERR